MSEYIDKDALMETLKNAHKRLIETIGYTQHTIGFEGAMDYVEEASTADVVEVRHGHWKREEVPCVFGKKFILTCSECGESVSVTEEALPEEHYCRSCGARMDGEEE